MQRVFDIDDHIRLRERFYGEAMAILGWLRA